MPQSNHSVQEDSIYNDYEEDDQPQPNNLIEEDQKNGEGDDNMKNNDVVTDEQRAQAMRDEEKEHKEMLQRIDKAYLDKTYIDQSIVESLRCFKAT